MQNVFTFPDGRKFALCYAQTPLGASNRQDTPLRSPQDIDQLMAYLGSAKLAAIWRDYYLDQSRTKQASPTAPASEIRKRIKADLWKGRLYFIPRDDPEDKPENIDQAIRTARTSLQMHLRSIIQEEQKEKAALEAEYKKLNIAEKALVSTGAAATGLGKATKDFLIWADNIVDVVDINRRAVRVASAAKKTYWEQNKKTWGQNIAEAEYKELVEALGFDPTKITRAQVNEALELAQLIWDDPETRNLLKLFAIDYAKAQHHTEWTEMAGGLSFEIILTLIIAALTGGAGGVAVVAKNLSLIGRLEKAGQALLTIGKKLKNLKVRAKRKLISVKNSLTSSGPSPKSKHDAVDEVMQKASEKPNPPVPEVPPVSKPQYLPGRNESDILAMPKGSRPDPKTYLEQKYIDSHLQGFQQEGGGFLFTGDDISNPSYQSFNPKKFVMRGDDLSAVIDEYKKTGDVSILETALGYDPKSLAGKDIYMVKLKDPKVVMPTGNEGGANSLWRPGGLTDPGGKREAVLDNISINHNNDINKMMTDFGAERIQ